MRRPASCASGGLALQVEREIRIHSRLDHPNIIQLFAAFEDDANVYMVQEYATGMCSLTDTSLPPSMPWPDPTNHTDPTWAEESCLIHKHRVTACMSVDPDSNVCVLSAM